MKKFLTLIVLVIMCSALQGQVNLNAGLAAYYPFNNNANDVSGNGNNPIFNNATPAADRQGNPNGAYYFNGIDNYMQVPNSASLNPTHISICAIVKPMGFYQGPCHGNVILNKGDDDNNLQSRYRLRFDDNLYTNQQNCANPIVDAAHENFFGDFGNNWSTLATYTPYVQLNQWYCIVYTFDGNQASFYLDGTLINSINTNTPYIPNSSDLFIGHLNSPAFPYWFNGAIDELRIYNRAINQQEVQALCSLCSIQGSFLGSIICAGGIGQLSFTATSGTGPFTLDYSDGTASYTQNNIQSGVPFNPQLNPITTTNYQLLKLTDASGCSISSGFSDDTAVVTVRPIPQGGITGGSVCAGQIPYLRYVSSQGNSPFSLQLSDGSSIFTENNVISNQPFAMPVLSNPGAVTYKLLSIGDNNGTGCQRNSGFVSDTAIVTINPSPQVSFSQLPSICQSDTTLIITQAMENSGMQGTGIFSGPIVSSSGQINLAQVSPGSYQILYVFTASNGCSDTAASTLTVSPIPSINIAPEILACPGSTIQLNVSGGTNYSWSPATGLSDPDISNPILTVKSSIVYQVTVTNGTGCAVMDSIKVIVSALGKAAYKVPNAFTPNGDGKNDCFGIQHWGGIDLQEFSIYNRWGQRVFSTKNPSVCWDGTINGSQQESGAFVYIIKANTPCGYIDLKGTVLLIR